jgi:hypothetical protein
MNETVCIPKEKYDFLMKCQKIIREIEEDNSLSYEEIKLIEKAKKSRLFTKNEFLRMMRES